MGERRPIAIVDLDGVVADVRHRLHFVHGRPKNWDGFFAAAHADPAHPEGLAVVARLGDDHEIVFVTGRPEQLREATVEWLDTHGLGQHRLVMRPVGDRRPAAQVKRRLIAALANDREIGIVVDDDPVVLDALRDAGYPTFAADWERRLIEDEDALRNAQEVTGRT